MRSLIAAVLLTAAWSAPASGQWPVGKGGYWAKLSWFHHETTEQFRPDGSRRPFLNQGAESISDALFLDVNVGVHERLDLWLQVPWFSLDFNDVLDERHSGGIGDIRLSARYNLLQLRGGSIPISARFTTKFPVQAVTLDAEVIPVGEGQFDYEAWIESGASFYPLPLYSALWIGYRWRTLNEETTRRPGDEVVFLAEVGSTDVFGGVGGKVVVDGIFGRPGAIQGLQLSDQDAREVLYVAPTILYSFTPSTMLEVAARIPLRGKNYPTGAPIQIGIFHTGTLFQ